MGMFDSYVPAPDLKCPGGGSALKGWQGKGGPCLMLTWNQEQRDAADPHGALFVGDADGKLLPNGSLFIYTQCEGCRAWIDAGCRVESDTWIETKIFNAVTEHQVLVWHGTPE